MRSILTSAIVLATACGDNADPVLYPAHDLVIVAHQDDDLLFMQPDLFALVSEHQPVTVVYVTAGDGGQPFDYVQGRQRAVRVAYSAVAGASDWRCTWISIADHLAEHCRLVDRDLSLVFLGYPDGGVVGELPASLLQLWNGTVDQATTIAEMTTTYDRAGLIDTVASIIDQTRPRIVRTLEVAGTHGDDHSDHMIVGALTQVALAETSNEAQLIAYRGYNVNVEPPNVSEAVYQQASLLMRSYSACMTSCGAVCGEAPCATVEDVRYQGFLHRNYTVESQSGFEDVMSSSAGCLGQDSSGEMVLVDCKGAPELALEPNGLLHIGDECFEVQSDGELVAGSCEHAPERHFELDEEGHLWTGSPPTESDSTLYTHTACVFASEGRVQAGACGADRDWRWQRR